MLGAYAIVTPQAHFATHENHAELNRYMRWEYGESSNVAVLLADVARASQKERARRRGNFADRIRAFTRALGKIAQARRSKAPMPEV